MGLGNYLMGDVSLNGEIHAFDAALLFRWLVADTTLTAQQQVIADVTCTAGATAFDATQILQYVANVISSFDCLQRIPARPGEETAPERGRTAPKAPDGAVTNGDGEYKVSLPEVAAVPGTVVELPLLFEGLGAAYSTQFFLAPTSGDVRILAIEPGEVAEGTSFYAHVLDDGTARIAMGSITELGRGVVATVRVEVADAEPSAVGEPGIAFTQALINEQDILATAAGAHGFPATTTPSLPDAFGLVQNVPNPFGPRTTIAFRIPADAGAAVRTDLSIYDVNGRRVRTLAADRRSPGEYEVTWDGRDDGGRRVASGVYFYRLQAGSFTAQKRMVLLK